MTCTPEYHAENKTALYDAKGIFCTYVCPKCETDKRKKYRADIFEDSNYWQDEDD